MREYKIHTLNNGIRVIHNQIATSKIVHCGIMLDVGSRDETHANQGIAHFWEHMAFKGTRKRKSFHILSRLESVGGELNAFTDKEKICCWQACRRTPDGNACKSAPRNRRDSLDHSRYRE